MNNTNPRRRFFKRATIAAALGAVVATAGITAFADSSGHVRAHRPGFMHASFSPEQAEKRIDRMLKHLYVEIDATDAQKLKLDPIAKAAAKDLLPLRAKMHDARKQGIALLAGDNIDRAAIEAFRVQQVQLAESASRRLTQALADVAEVLTPDQRKQLAQRLEHMGRGRHGAMHHGDRHHGDRHHGDRHHGDKPQKG